MEAPDPTAETSAQSLAQACADTMWRDDQASKTLGMTIQRVAPGEAMLLMTVRQDMTNSHGICHGGFIFTLADSAFAFACNTYGQRTVAQQCAVTFIRPGRAGETLTAHAVERSKTDRSGIYDVTVRDGQGKTVAEFRGHSRTISGAILAPSSNTSS
ncbi:hydroxyphenylacetyl-CoA thioesterase PaaI [Methylocapsa sp. S129]|uniref:hydroxyphenylacetyl-CoA thioesterase PaaI n=1 Tax=Methylocapsa sp. S129 TaxID=1641869 RepID=UPI00131DCD11|nr:hydroxyphenylacetyl-CoA thioesterase PaaI [Methylocapsa sp. S129]